MKLLLVFVILSALCSCVTTKQTKNTESGQKTITPLELPTNKSTIGVGEIRIVGELYNEASIIKCKIIKVTKRGRSVPTVSANDIIILENKQDKKYNPGIYKLSLLSKKSGMPEQIYWTIKSIDHEK